MPRMRGARCTPPLSSLARTDRVAHVVEMESGGRSLRRNHGSHRDWGRRVERSGTGGRRRRAAQRKQAERRESSADAQGPQEATAVPGAMVHGERAPIHTAHSRKHAPHQRHGRQTRRRVGTSTGCARYADPATLSDRASSCSVLSGHQRGASCCDVRACSRGGDRRRPKTRRKQGRRRLHRGPLLQPQHAQSHTHSSTPQHRQISRE